METPILVIANPDLAKTISVSPKVTNQKQAVNVQVSTSKHLVCLNTFDSLLKIARKDSNAAAPRMHIFNPEVAKIIKK